MPLNLPLYIAGVGRYVPERCVTNEGLEQQLGLPPGWILRRNGVAQRHWANPQETNSYMGARAAEEALTSAGLTLGDIDLIINASATNELSVPDTSVYIQRELGANANGIACWTIHATCLSFLVALDTSASLLASGRYSNILIVSAEISSTSLNPDEPESFSLFGDGAAAAVVSLPTPETNAHLKVARFKSYNEGADYTTVRGGGTRYHPNDPATVATDNSFHMEGRSVLRLSHELSKPFLESIQTGLASSLGNIDVVVPHQSSLVGLKLLAGFGWPADNIVTTLKQYGNCISASLPLTLYEAIRTGQLQRSNNLLMVGTGAGLSLGGLLLRY